MSFLAVLIKHPSLSGSKTDLMHALLLEDSKGDLLLNSNVLLKLSSLLVLKNYLHLIFLLKSEMSLRKYTSLVEQGVGESPFSNTFI